ncbi:MAG: A/G-specific adenine glycosylase [Candidatus Edwardsbacteria bacterium]|jgi:A/G-specific adenine glycosylase|nr:A/G-specific adenine glycosylase [Candidatus Edwardsbacteria bacterium]
MKRCDELEIRSFRDVVLRHHRRYGRHDLPWRRTTDPYRILVSELMLQQTQVPRVVPKYLEFIARFPDVGALARAPLRRVLAAWSGLGYNRRALYLKRAAQAIVAGHGGGVPDSLPELVRLPGIGANTAGAILAYAFDRPAVFIETNIRTVYADRFFPSRRTVGDRELLPLVELTLDRRHPRRWYGALMDYGAWLKAHGAGAGAGRPRQGRFQGSDRQLRGNVIRLLTVRAMSFPAIRAAVREPAARVDRILKRLAAEGLVTARAGTYRIS